MKYLCILRLFEEELYCGGKQLQLNLGRFLLERLQEVLQLLVRVVDALSILTDDPDYTGLRFRFMVSWHRWAESLYQDK